MGSSILTHLDLCGAASHRSGWCHEAKERGDIRLDPAKPDGTPRKLLHVSRLHNLGWHARIGLREGIAGTYEWFRGESGLS